MCFRYDDIGRVFTQEEKDKQNQIDLKIMEFIRNLKPTRENIYFNKFIIGKIRETLIDIYTKDLKLCTERAFYP